MKLRRTFGLTMIYVILSSSNLFAQTRDLRNARTHPVPITFDEDKVELPESPRVAHEANITVGGTFRNSCERSIETRVESPDAHTHYVKAVALSLVDYACAQVERDYSQVVSLGRLDAGDHALMVEDDRGSFVVRYFTVGL